MSRRDDQRLNDIILAGDAIREHLDRGSLDDGLADVAAMRNHLAHRCFDTDHPIVRATLDLDLPPLEAAVRRLLGRLG